jgi:hypothetical protein
LGNSKFQNPNSKESPIRHRDFASLDVEAFQIGLSVVIGAWKLNFAATFTAAGG